MIKKFDCINMDPNEVWVDLSQRTKCPALVDTSSMDRGLLIGEIAEAIWNVGFKSKNDHLSGLSIRKLTK